MTTTAQKLRAARERLARAEALAGVTSDRASLPNDPGAHSGIRRTTTPRQARKTAAAVDRSIDAAVELTKAQKEVERLEVKAIKEKSDSEIRANSTVDLDRLKPGDLIRYEQYGSPRGIGRVLRVNKKTVTLESAPVFDTPKIPFERIIGTIHEEDRTHA